MIIMVVVLVLVMGNGGFLKYVLFSQHKCLIFFSLMRLLLFLDWLFRAFKLEKLLSDIRGHISLPLI